MFDLKRIRTGFSRTTYFLVTALFLSVTAVILVRTQNASADIQVTRGSESATCRFRFITLSDEEYSIIRNVDYSGIHEDVADTQGVPVESLSGIAINPSLPENPPSNNVNMIVGVATSGAFNELILCSSYSFIQNSSNEAVYNGGIGFYDEEDNVVSSCDSRFSFSSFSSEASGSVEGTLSVGWSDLELLATDNCGSVSGRSTNLTNAVTLPTNTVAADFLGDPGSGSGGQPQQPGGDSGAITYQWHDITEIGRYVGDSTTASETYVLVPNEWSGHEDDELVYELGTTDDEVRRRLIGRTTDSGESCTPRVVFSSSGNGSGSLDFNFDGGDSFATFVEELNNFLAEGSKTGQYYESEPSGTTCSDPTNNSVAIGNDSRRDVFWRHYPDNSGGATIAMPFQSAGSREQRFYGLTYTYDAATNSWTAPVPGCENTPSTIAGAGNGVRPSINTAVGVVWTVVSPDNDCSRLQVSGMRLLGTAGNAVANTGDLTSSESLDDSCESNSGALGWIMCPLAGALDSVTGWLDSQVQGLLTIKDDYFTGTSGAALQNAWQQIRNVAFIILIPIMLVMVIGTAIGVEAFSAYTVRKALPRMVIAIMFITLSWYICVFMVNFVNVLGVGVRGLVTQPFNEVTSANMHENCVGPQTSLKAALTAANIVRPSGTEDGDCNQTFADDAEGVAGQVTLGLVGAGSVLAGFALGVISIVSILSMLASAALILGIMFLLLMARQMFIIALIMLAPLAILAWIFPGNDKLWKLWWSAFSKLLLIFPLIMLMVGIGQVFAMVSGVALSNGSRLVAAIFIVLAWIAPYLLIPFAFKWAGGVFGNLAGMVNDRGKGALDRLKKGRAEDRAKGWNAFKTGTGTRFGQKNALARGVGTRIGAGVGGGRGVFGTGFTKAQKERGKARLDQMNRENSISQVMKNPAWNGVNQDDNALHAGILLEDMNDADAKEAMITRLAASEMKKNPGMSVAQARSKVAGEADRSISAWKASGLGGRAAAIAASQQLVSTGTGYEDMNDMAKTLARASGGNTSTATALAGFANSETKRVGRGDLAPSFGTLSGLVNKEVASRSSGGPTAGATAGPTYSDYDNSVVKSSRGQDAVTLLRGKPKEMENLTTALGNHYLHHSARAQDTSLSHAERAESQSEALKSMSQIRQFNDSKSYASQENQDHVNALMARTQGDWENNWASRVGSGRTQQPSRQAPPAPPAPQPAPPTGTRPGPSGPIATSGPGAGGVVITPSAPQPPQPPQQPASQRGDLADEWEMLYPRGAYDANSPNDPNNPLNQQQNNRNNDPGDNGP